MDATTTSATGMNGAVDLNFSSLPLNQQTSLATGNDIWVKEIPQASSTETFGALRCYNDALNGDDLEFIKFRYHHSRQYLLHCLRRFGSNYLFGRRGRQHNHDQHQFYINLD